MKALTKPKKKPTRGKLKTKCDWLASAYYRAQTPYCEAAGKDSTQCGGGLQWCHLFSRGILHIRYEPYNNLIMCQGHHLLFTYRPIEWTRFLERHFPDKLAEAEANRYKFSKVDYDAWISHFKVNLAEQTDQSA